MGRKRRSPAAVCSSPRASKKISVDDDLDTARSDNETRIPNIVQSSSVKTEPKEDDKQQQDYLQLIETTMTELLLKRGPMKTC